MSKLLRKLRESFGFQNSDDKVKLSSVERINQDFNPFKFHDQRLLLAIKTGLKHLTDAYFPSEIECKFLDTSTSNADILTFYIVGPHGLTVSVPFAATEFKDRDFSEYLKVKVYKTLVSKVGNYELAEKDNSSFLALNGLSSSNNLLNFHYDENLLMTAGQRLYFSYVLEGYPASNDDIIPIFEQTEPIIVQKIAEHLQTAFSDLTVKAIPFMPANCDGFIGIQIRVKRNHGVEAIVINLFPSVVTKKFDHAMLTQYFYDAIRQKIAFKVNELPNPHLTLAKYVKLCGTDSGSVEDKAANAKLLVMLKEDDNFLKLLVQNLPEDYVNI